MICCTLRSYFDLDRRKKGSLCAGAEIAMSRKTSEGMDQEVKHTTSHVFAGNNPAEWWLRLDGYLPLLPSMEKDEPLAQSANDTIKTRSDVRPAMISDNVIGVITIFIWRKNSMNINNGTSPYQISSGRVKAGEDILRISKELLAIHSQYFSTLFYGGFKEKGMEVITLPDLSRPALSSMLHLISTPGIVPKSVDAACELLEIANRCEVLGVITKCSKYLKSVKLNEKEASVVLSSANACGQSDLLKHALNSFTSPSTLKDAFCPVAAIASPETTVAAFTHLSNMVAMRGCSSMNQLKVYLRDPHRHIQQCFELFYDRVPSIAWSFVLLLTKNFSGFLTKRITISGCNYTVNSEWREDIDGTTPRNGDGLMLYTNSTTTFEITNENHTTGHFFGRIVNERGLAVRNDYDDSYYNEGSSLEVKDLGLFVD